MNLVVLGFLFHLTTPQSSLPAQGSEGISFVQTDSFVLYIGTNDKDANEALFTLNEAQAIVDGISQKYTDGFTSVAALGHWNSPENIWVSEDTLVYLYYGISEDQIRDIADEVVAELNQYSVVIERGSRYIAYYPPGPQ